MRKHLLPALALITAASGLEAALPAVSTYGKLPDGREVKAFTLTNGKGITAKVIEYGALLVSLEMPDPKGQKADVVLGYDTLAEWLADGSHFGASVGRFGNRIANGRFNLDGKDYALATNNFPGGIPCHLHGGKVGFDKVLWTGKAVQRKGAHGPESGVELTRLSPDGEEGYPGNLKTQITYWLSEANELIWDVKATTDKATILNIANHTYWNLTGNPTASILGHILTLPADRYLPTNAGLIPTGKLEPVAGTPMDFRKPTPIGERVNADFQALKLGGGYDHCWVLNGKGLRTAAKLKDPVSGRSLEILTNQPGVQFYTGNFLDGKVAGKGGVKYAFRTALCLETEGFPDAPNQPSFPSAVLRPGQTYKHTMVVRFGR